MMHHSWEARTPTWGYLSNMVRPQAKCFTYGPNGDEAWGLFSEDVALEAWERMTYGGVQWISDYSFAMGSHRGQDTRIVAIEEGVV